MKRTGRIDRRQFGLGALASGLLAKPAIAAGPSLKGTGSVSVFDGGGAWGEALKKAYFEPFEAETGIKVIPTPRSPAGVMRQGILAGVPKYDVIDISGGRLSAFVREGLLLPIDYGWWDPADRAAIQPVQAYPHGVPSIIYSLLMSYDPARFGGKPPRVWADLWDAKGFPGARTLGTGAEGPAFCTIEIALLADGVAPDKLYPLDFDRAFRSLSRVKPNVVKWWSSGAESVQLLIDQEASAGSAWNGRIVAAQEGGAKVDMSWEQGILQWDCWSVPKGAANVENAMKFIAFASLPKQQAIFAENILYSPSNQRAFAHIDPKRAAQLPTVPALASKQIVQNYDWWNALDAQGNSNEKRAILEWERWLTGTR